MFEFELPDLGEGVAEGELLAWHVAPGDHVDEDQVLAEVETDKAAVDVPSPVAGTIQERQYEPGDIVETGAVLVTIDTDEAGDTDGEATDESSTIEGTSTEETSTGGGRVFAPPTVRRLARELGVDLTTVDGTGPSGRITEGDVRRIGDGEGEQSAGEASGAGDGETAVKSAVRPVGDDEDEQSADRDQTLATPSTRKVARELGVNIDAVPTDQMRDGQPYVDEAAVRACATELAAGEEPGETVAATAESEPAITETTAEQVPTERREPYRGVRRRIGQQMQRSRQEVPHATHHDQAVVSGLVEARDRLEPLAEERAIRLTYTPFLLKSVAAALADHPILNTELDTEAEEIIYRDEYHIGVATATDDGLVVPVVENVGEKGLLELAREVNDLVERARSRDVAREELQGGTFTVTNFGAIGGEYADPIINVPETAILGTGALKKRPVAAGETRTERASRDGKRGERGADRRESPRQVRPASGEVLAKPTLPLSLAIDHRVIDGADAARFVNTLKEYLADPTLLLL
ncbi:branched-chain alpha-keto acid dehydrogenase subunit E2 [Halobacteriales archaeon QS_4_62_28]|nr:MAG: branched-chain alpha-keto acid dehydrogenase subunit E2 [Halobacteriales archaeon QS_4_62_28]